MWPSPIHKDILLTFAQTIRATSEFCLCTPQSLPHQINSEHHLAIHPGITAVKILLNVYPTPGYASPYSHIPMTQFGLMRCTGYGFPESHCFSDTSSNRVSWHQIFASFYLWYTSHARGAWGWTHMLRMVAHGLEGVWFLMASLSPRASLDSPPLNTLSSAKEYKPLSGYISIESSRTGPHQSKEPGEPIHLQQQEALLAYGPKQRENQALRGQVSHYLAREFP